MSPTQRQAEVPLPIAAMRLRVSGEVARRMVLRGELAGRLVKGRWVVSEASVSRKERERDDAPSMAP